MKGTKEIQWENLKDIPFTLCQTKEDNENTKVYYMSELVLHDYNHVGQYLSTAIVLF